MRKVLITAIVGVVTGFFLGVRGTRLAFENGTLEVVRFEDAGLTVVN